MLKTRFLYRSFIFALMIASCAIEVPQSSANRPDPTPKVVVTDSGANNNDTTQIPVTWASLNLTGKLIYNMGSIENDNYIVRVRSLDLVTGQVTTIYRAPINAWVYYVSVSPDGKQVVMSFSPPPGEDPEIVQALYVMPVDGSKPPQLLFKPPIREDQYTQAEWSPDGKYIYYTHVNYQFPEDPNRVYPLYQIFRMEYPNGQPELIAEEAYWPRLSSDSARLTYISIDPLSIKQELIIAEPDGSNAREVSLAGSYIPDIKDAPIFSPDGVSILFSGAVPTQSRQLNWFEKLMEMRRVKANGNVPSDWWSAPTNGGELTRLTHIQASGLYASLSPDGKHMVSFSGAGILVMNLDGSELRVLMPNPDLFTGTVQWIP
jgi:Tol biopolymer transport system component